METSFQNKLIEIVKTDSRFIDQDGELVKAAIIDRAWKIDRDLVKLLLSDASIKAKFFDEIEGHWVFNVNTFIDYISDKDFLDNSYTRFRNKIGLNIDGRYLKERGEVCLVWPYKDCILEGGQTKEEEKRKEIFFNEILAQDEIDRLLDPKVLTNWKRYTTEGEQKVSEIKRDEGGVIKENLLIKGNNLIALHCLKHQFRNQVKLIYIDPPYNTGNDSFQYNDNFNHSSWLTYMKNRLDIAKEFLRVDGLIFVQCDNNEQAYLKVLMDEIFNRDNFLSTIAYERSGVAGLGQGGKFIVNVTEYILVYAKDFNSLSTYNLEKIVPLDLKHMKRYNGILQDVGTKELFNEFTSKSTGEIVHIYKHNNYHIEKISLANYQENKTNILGTYLKNFENIFRLNIPQKENSFQHQIINSFDDEELYSVEYLVSRGRNKGQVITNYYYQRQLLAWLKSSASIENDSINKINKMSDFWTNDEIPKADLANEGGVTLGRGKKPEQLMKRIIEISTEPYHIVLDFTLGSGSTCAVAHKMGRQYIGIEQLDYGDNDGIKRLQNVIKGDSSGISKAANWQGGGDFIYCELMKHNESFIDKINSASASDEFVEIWKDISKNSFLNWYINPEAPEDALSDFIEIGKSDNGVEKQKKLLCELLNKNQLYVNLSEINDTKFGVNEHDKELNKQFYGDAYNA